MLRGDSIGDHARPSIHPRQDLEEVGVVPARTLARIGDAEFSTRILPDQVQREMAKDREALGRIARPVTRLVLAERHVQHPVQLGLDRPVPTDGAGC